MNKPDYHTSDSVRTIDSDYVCWLKLHLQFYEVNGSKWAWFDLICLLYCLLHFKILIKTTAFCDDQLKGIYLQFISTIKSTIMKGNHSIVSKVWMMSSLCLIKEHSKDYIILPKEEFHPKSYRTKVLVPKMEEPIYWYLDQMKEVTKKELYNDIP